MPRKQKLAGSFRDPDGFLFIENGNLLRQINSSYKADYNLLMKNLYDDLVGAKLLIPHSELDSTRRPPGAYKVIQPEWIEFISYPYEWSFSQYKDAALTTLEIQRRSLNAGMSLKDASAYNVQFFRGKPIFIDTLSFEEYKEGKPWIAYKQFCQHFLAPLALMAYVDIDLSKLMRVYIDGIPLSLASHLLPGRTKASSLLAHIHLHSRSQQRYADKGSRAGALNVSRQAQLGIINSLAKSIKKLEWNPKGTEWGEYYSFTNYSSSAFKQKQKLVEEFIVKTKPKTLWDIGANDGSFSRLASDKSIKTVAFDIDPIAVEKNYQQVKNSNEDKILPLIMDLTNPSPNLGWAHSERRSMTGRGPADTVLALAIIHHLAISNNLPLDSIGEWLAKICSNLIIEFVPKSDSQVKKLLSSREDIFPNYNEKDFEKLFKNHFKLIRKEKIPGTRRSLYLFRTIKA